MTRPTPDLLRGMTRSRRDALRLFGLAGAGTALAACGVKGQKAAPPKQTDVQKYWAGKTRHGHVNFANWTLYIDKNRETLKEFTNSGDVTEDDEAKGLKKIQEQTDKMVASVDEIVGKKEKEIMEV